MARDGYKTYRCANGLCNAPFDAHEKDRAKGFATFCSFACSKIGRNKRPAPPAAGDLFGAE